MSETAKKKTDPFKWVLLALILLFAGILLVQRGGMFAPKKSAAAAGPTVELTSGNFSEQIAQGVILVDVWAEWCKPCKAMEPTLEALATAMEGRARVGKLDADANRELAESLGVQAIPTMILYKDGQEVERFIGMKSEESLKEAMEKALNDI
ncbi:MAG TPA: thioredoxin [Bacteroidales bacterium]|nr:thioredoxin [Bacteroidales bacterium]HRZ77483.1 thioredoxin [Bacteroidales bacterium]